MPGFREKGEMWEGCRNGEGWIFGEFGEFSWTLVYPTGDGSISDWKKKKKHKNSSEGYSFQGP